MTAVQPIEADRLALQAQLDSTKTSLERNKLGQFATPTALATDILQYAHRQIPAQMPIRFLDPAIGTGAFYSALLNVFSPEQVASAIGYEIDPHYGDHAAVLWQATGLQLRLADFTRAPIPQADSEKASLLICNPPYVRHHHFNREEKTRLRSLAQQSSGMELSGLSGLYCYFLGIAHAWLADGGIAGWLIPSEWMDVNYGQSVRAYLLDQVTLIQIHRFAPHDVQFGDALVSSVVVWFRKAPPLPDHETRFTYGGTIHQPSTTTIVSTERLRASQKWSQLTHERPAPLVQSSNVQVRLGDLFTIQRGLATGGNEFFVLTPEQIEQHALPARFLTPILPSPRHLLVDEVLADVTGEPLLDRKFFLLTCDLPEADIQIQYPALWQYLQHGRTLGIHMRYLCRHRTPWYTQERRPPPPFVCTYMGRTGTRRGSPFRFIRNHSRATAANVYLLLYPQSPLKEMLSVPSMRDAVWASLQQITPEALIDEGRVYGGGLHKLEPKELANARLELPSLMDAAGTVVRSQETGEQQPLDI